MNAKRHKSGKKKTAPTQPEPIVTTSQPTQPGIWIFWILATLLLLGFEGGELQRRIHIVPPPLDSPLAGESAWNAPISRLPAMESLGNWDSWLYAIVAGGIIAWCCRTLARSTNQTVAVVLLVGMACCFSPDKLILIALLACISLFVFARNQAPGSASSVWRIGLLAVGALLVSVDFGFVWLCLIVMSLCESSLSDTNEIKKQRLLMLLCCLLAISASALFHAGFRAALLRPINWLWLDLPPNLLLSLQPVFRNDRPVWIDGILLAGLAIVWIRWWKTEPKQKLLPLLCLSALSLLGLGCGFYLLPVVVFLSLTAPNIAITLHSRRIDRALLTACMLFAVVRLGMVSSWFGLQEGEGLTASSQVDITEWNTSGRAMLKNLDRSAQWEHSEIGSAYPLIIDDRWDVFGNDYREYAAICRDLSEVRIDSYLRSDGEYGGYMQTLERWKPQIFVVDSSDLDSIRSLSLSPDWSLLSVDAQRTIFGWREDKEIARQMALAGATLLSLEWPKGVAELPSSQVLAASNANQMRQVAAVLCAIRLPYASLRVLPRDDQVETLQQRMWCDLEIAHRVRRYAATVSLLDQCRGVALAKELWDRAIWTEEDRFKLVQSLDGLGVCKLAQKFSTELLSGSDVAQQSVQNEILISIRDKACPPDSLGSVKEAESNIRDALLQGETQLAEQDLDKLSAAVKPYYRLLTNSPHESSVELYRVLNDVVEAKDFPVRLHAEAWFQLGCLALEVGDGRTARDWFVRVESAESASPYRFLSRMYLSQLNSGSAR